MAELTVRIRLEPGPVVRQIDGIEWSAVAGWEQDVPVALAADLLSYPRPGWSLAEKPTAAALRAVADALGVAPENIVVGGGGEHNVRLTPTLAEVTGDRKRAAALRDMGVTVKGLAAMTEMDIHDLSFRSGATVAEIAGWVEQARAA
jgi:hypothetical protein